MSSHRSLLAKGIVSGGLGLLIALALGCGFTANLINVVKGHKIKAEFDGLEGKRVAVACVSNASSYGPNSICSLLERSVGAILQQEVEDIDMIPTDEVADWIDNNGWDQTDYREIGRGIDADMVLAIDLDGLRLHEGRTLYKGRADVVVTVYDMTDGGKVAFRKEMFEFAFPRSGARHTTEISEGSFRRLFVTVLAKSVTKYFHDYHIEEDFATDALQLGT